MKYISGNHQRRKKNKVKIIKKMKKGQL